MAQPKWKLVYSTDYSALFIDTTGVYEPELMIAQEWEDDGETKFEVFRFPIDKLKTIGKNDYLVSVKYDSSWPHPVHQYNEWFADSLDAVASYIGSDEEALIEALISDDPKQRAWAYESIGSYHGFMNFDSYPRTWSEEEMDKRWP